MNLYFILQSNLANDLTIATQLSGLGRSSVVQILQKKITSQRRLTILLVYFIIM
jgi:hypothetical protein